MRIKVSADYLYTQKKNLENTAKKLERIKRNLESSKNAIPAHLRERAGVDSLYNCTIKNLEKLITSTKAISKIFQNGTDTIKNIEKEHRKQCDELGKIAYNLTKDLEKFQAGIQNNISQKLIFGGINLESIESIPNQTLNNRINVAYRYGAGTQNSQNSIQKTPYLSMADLKKLKYEPARQDIQKTQNISMADFKRLEYEQVKQDIQKTQNISMADFKMLEYETTEDKYRTYLKNYEDIEDPARRVFLAWVDTEPKQRVEVLQNERSSFFLDEFFLRLGYLQYRKKVDVTKLSVEELDELYTKVHYDKMEMIVIGIDVVSGMLASQAANQASKQIIKEGIEEADNGIKGSTKTAPKTTLDYLKDIEVKNGKYYTSKEIIDEIGEIEAKGVDFSKLDSKVMSSRVSTEGGTSKVIKYSDDNGTKFIIHEVTDAKGNIIHRDFDAVRIESGQLINKK